jgi:TP901 family phage tail tape measure protein
MANLTSSLTIKLIDEVSKPARSVAQALKDAEKAAEAVAKGMGRTAGSDPFRRQLASLKLTASELRDVRKEWLLYARASKQAMGAEWVAKGAARMRAWERQTIASIRAAKREQMAFGKTIGMAAAARGGRFGALGGAASDFASFALPGAAGMAMGLGVGAVGGMAVGGATAYSVKKAIDFDKAMAEVRKKVNLDAGASFADVETMINASARRIGIAREEVAGLVAQAGQAGVEFRDLAGFMDLTTKGAVAFDVPAREMAQKLAEIKAATGWTNAELGEFVDKVNMLGDIGASAERDIVEMFGRSAAAAKAANVPLDTTLAVTTALNSIGMQPEVASRFWNAFSSKLRTFDGKEAAKNLMELGLSLKEVQEGMKSDATATPTILKLLEALDKSAEKARIGQGLFGREWWDEAARSGQALPEIVKNLRNLMDTAKWRGSSDQALNLQLETTANHLDRIKALASEVGDALGRWALPGINKAIDSTIRTVEDWMHPKGPSTAPGSLANYEARLGLQEKPKAPPPASFLGLSGALRASGAGKAKGGPSWAASPQAGPVGVTGGVSANYLPAFQRMQGAPSLDLSSLNAAKAAIDIAGTALQSLNTTVTPRVDASSVEAVKGSAEGAHAAVESLNMTASPTVNTGSIDAAIAKANELRSLLSGIGAQAAAAGNAAANAAAQTSRAAAAIGSAASAARSNYVVPSIPGRT